MNKAIEKALLTWYPKDHPLHLDPLHPAMGLVGEVGEWINKHKKDRFKPGFKFTREDELDKLSNIWYYIRILVYQQATAKNDLDFDSINILTISQYQGINTLMSRLVYQASVILLKVANIEDTDLYWLVQDFKGLLVAKNTNLDELTRLNWQKLKPGSERGEEWAKAWEK